MDSSSPLEKPAEPRLSIKSSSSSQIGNQNFNGEDHPHLTLGLLLNTTSSSPPKNRNPSKPNLNFHPSDSSPLQEIVLLYPTPNKKTRTRNFEKIEMAEEPIDGVGPKKRSKSKASSMAPPESSSPVIRVRRSRRRLDQENRDERELGIIGEEIVKPRKKRQTRQSRKEKLSLVVSSSLPTKVENEEIVTASDSNNIRELISDLIMWKDVSKSSLWFGFGCLFFLSSFSTTSIRYSVFSVFSHLGLLFLALSFLSNSCSQRNDNDRKLDFELKEDDIVRLAKKILPVANLVIAKTKELFSGEPSMTLKVAPFLLFGAEYGHLLTIWRLCAIGFFISFTIPKLYSCYSMQIDGKVEFLSGWIWEAWKASSHKKIVAVSAASAFWNLSSLKTRIFSAFVCMVIFRYRRQRSGVEIEQEREVEGEHENEKEEGERQNEKKEEEVEEQKEIEVDKEDENEVEEQGKALMVIEKK